MPSDVIIRNGFIQDINPVLASGCLKRLCQLSGYCLVGPFDLALRMPRSAFDMLDLVKVAQLGNVGEQNPLSYSKKGPGKKFLILPLKMKIQMKTEDEIKEMYENHQLNNSKTCLKCGSKTSEVTIKGKRMMQCSWRPCRHRYTLKSDLFIGLKTKPWMILRILDCWMQGISTKHISFITGLYEKTIRNVLKRLRKIIVPKYYETAEKIGEKDHIVEIDESKFGKRKYNKGHHVEGVWILGMVDRETRKIHLVVVDKRDAATLENRIERNVADDSIIYTDCWRGYNGINAICESHETVNHSKFFKDPSTGVHTNTIEGNWYAVKSQVPLRNRTKGGIPLYLVRFMIKRNNSGDPLKNLLRLKCPLVTPKKGLAKF